MFEVVLAGVCALDQRLLAKCKTFAIFSQWSREQRAESVSSLPSEKEKVKNEEGKVIKTNQRSLITEHHGDFCCIKPLQMAPPRAYFIDALGAAVRKQGTHLG